jgi:hypothetical protein
MKKIFLAGGGNTYLLKYLFRKSGFDQQLKKVL